MNVKFFSKFSWVIVGCLLVTLSGCFTAATSSKKCAYFSKKCAYSSKSGQGKSLCCAAHSSERVAAWNASACALCAEYVQSAAQAGQ